MKNTGKKNILMICCLDGLANNVRTLRIKAFLQKNGYSVNLLDINDRKFLRAAESFKLLMKGSVFSGKLSGAGMRYPFVESREAIAETILDHMAGKRYGAIICQAPMGADVINKEIDSLKIYDCPTPLPEELGAGYEFARKPGTTLDVRARYYTQFHPECVKEIEKREMSVYRKADHLCFHWKSYADYVKDSGYSGKNIFILDWGCSIRQNKAKYGKKPRVAFIGNLADYWVNLELLSYLTKMSPYPIHCYGRPKPEKRYRLNFKRPVENSGFLNRYQFGLVTVTKDRLRVKGFSAKTLDYVSYGLPVLIPKWRMLNPFIGGCIQYDEKDFISKLYDYSGEKLWRRKSDEAYEYAQSHGWDSNLRPLLYILNKSLN